MKNIKIPEHTSFELAELFGILFGDGCVNYYPKKNDYCIIISGNRETDFSYHTNHIKRIVFDLFCIEPHITIRQDQNCIISRIRNKEIFMFLVEKDIFVGKKIRVDIPEWIKNNDRYFYAFVRGLIDTDGCITLRARGQHSISLGMKNENIILDVKNFLESHGYRIPYYVEERDDSRGFHSVVHRISINQKKLIRKYAEEIGSSNPYKKARLEKIINGPDGI